MAAKKPLFVSIVSSNLDEMILYIYIGKSSQDGLMTVY